MEDAWMDAARETLYAFIYLNNAKTISDQGTAIKDLADAISDLCSWLPEYDYSVGLDSVGQKVES